MTSTIEDLLARLGAVSAAEKEIIVKTAIERTADMKWVPNPGPQTEAYLSKADVLLYGGEPGGGKSQLILGLAFNCHRKSLIMRREYGDLQGLIDDAIKIHGSKRGFNGSPPPRLRVSNSQLIQFRAAQRVGDEQGTMGQGRDLLGVDEATHFAESQIRFLMGWVRTDIPGQRTRTVLATNPPLKPEGLWVVKMFAPWLDPNHPNPAAPGELRWCVSDEEGNDEWVNGPEDFRIIKGKKVFPLSRTYIPAKVADNPYYAGTDYEKTLDAMPEPFRSQLMGGFRTAFKDDEYQIIPTAWIEAAQARWTPDGWKQFIMTAMSVDPAGGGVDAMETIWRHGGWFAPPVSLKGEETLDGSICASQVIRYRRDACPVIVDSSGGYGGRISERLKDNGVIAVPFNGAAKSTTRTNDAAKLPFFNKRAEALWRFREALDPDQEGGSVIALPPDPELKADLAAYRMLPLRIRGIQVEDKEDIKKRIGRSPGKGDAAFMCLSEGERAVEKIARSSRRSGRPVVNLGYAQQKRAWAK